MQRWRNIALAVGWIGLVWMVIRRTNEAPISDVFWIDLTYNVGIIALAVLFVVGLLILMQHLLKLSMVPFVGALVLFLIAFAALEGYWLRTFAAQLIQRLN